MKPTSVRYGPDRAQVAEVWRPEVADAPLPVVVLIHGGFWRQRYGKRLMHRLAKAMAKKGWMAYNIEYRRVGSSGRGGWPQTFEDVSDAIDALADVDGVDHLRVATCGHSAGGHLALWAASSRSTGDRQRREVAIDVCAAISLAGVVDLDAAARQFVGAGAVTALMGGTPDEVPDRYRLGSPASLLPVGKPQFLLHGLDDESVPPSLSAHYVEKARALGDPALYVPFPDVAHMEMISARGVTFEAIMANLDSVFGPARP
jgi:acetyl esterase/lipase